MRSHLLLLLLLAVVAAPINGVAAWAGGQWDDDAPPVELPNETEEEVSERVDLEVKLDKLFHDVGLEREPLTTRSEKREPQLAIHDALSVVCVLDRLNPRPPPFELR